MIEASTGASKARTAATSIEAPNATAKTLAMTNNLSHESNVLTENKDLGNINLAAKDGIVNLADIASHLHSPKSPVLSTTNGNQETAGNSKPALKYGDPGYIPPHMRVPSPNFTADGKSDDIIKPSLVIKDVAAQTKATSSHQASSGPSSAGRVKLDNQDAVDSSLNQSAVITATSTKDETILTTPTTEAQALSKPGNPGFIPPHLRPPIPRSTKASKHGSSDVKSSSVHRSPTESSRPAPHMRTSEHVAKSAADFATPSTMSSSPKSTVGAKAVPPHMRGVKMHTEQRATQYAMPITDNKSGRYIASYPCTPSSTVGSKATSPAESAQISKGSTDDVRTPPHLRTPNRGSQVHIVASILPPHLRTPVVQNPQAQAIADSSIPPHMRKLSAKASAAAEKQSNSLDTLAAISESEACLAHSKRFPPDLASSPSHVSSKHQSKDSAVEKTSPHTSSSGSPGHVHSKATPTEFTTDLAGDRPILNNYVPKDKNQTQGNVWASEEHPWEAGKRAALEAQVAKIHAERGPAPARFSKPMYTEGSKQLRAAIASQDQLPGLSDQLEKYLPRVLQAVPRPVFLGNQYEREKEEEEAKKREDEARAKALRGEARAKAKAKAIAKKAAEADARKNKIGDSVEHGKVFVSDQVSKPAVTKDPKLLEDGTPSKPSTSPDSHNTLTTGNLEKLSGQKARYTPPPGSREKSIISDDGSLFTHGKNKNVSGTKLKQRNVSRPFQLYQYNMMHKYIEKAVSIILEVNERPHVADDIVAYRDEWHDGAPSELTDNDSLIADNLSELDFERATGEVTENEVYRWRWFSKREESLATRDDNEEVPEKLACEITDWDGNFELIDRISCTNQIEQLGEKIRDIEHWLDGIIHTAMKRPYKVDTTTAEYRSGIMPASGLRRKYLEIPPWMLGQPQRPEYDPIDWSRIPTLPAPDDFSRDPVRMNTTSNICIVVANEQAVAKLKNQKREREDLRKKREQAERGRRKTKGPALHNPCNAQLVDNPWVPSANIYLRPACLGDTEACSDFYNDWIRSSVQATEVSARGREYFDRIYSSSEADEMPFIVAVLKGKARNKGGRSGRKSYRETIVGCSWVDNVGEKDSILQFNAEIQVWVHQEYLRQGIGKNLFDRIVTALDRTWQTHCGTDFISPGKEIRWYFNGGHKPRRKLIFNLFWEENAKDLDYKWKQQWLEKQGWYVGGFIFNGAVKFGRPYVTVASVQFIANLARVHWTIMVRECESSWSNRSCGYMMTATSGYLANSCRHLSWPAGRHPRAVPGNVGPDTFAYPTLDSESTSDSRLKVDCMLV